MKIIVSVSHRNPNCVLFATELLLMCWYDPQKNRERKLANCYYSNTTISKQTDYLKAEGINLTILICQRPALQQTSSIKLKLSTFAFQQTACNYPFRWHALAINIPIFLNAPPREFVNINLRNMRGSRIKCLLLCSSYGMLFAVKI